MWRAFLWKRDRDREPFLWNNFDVTEWKHVHQCNERELKAFPKTAATGGGTDCWIWRQKLQVWCLEAAIGVKIVKGNHFLINWTCIITWTSHSFMEGWKWNLFAADQTTLKQVSGMAGVSPMSSVAPRQRHGIDHLRPYLCGGLAAVAAEMVTFPLDTAKTRQQLQGQVKHI